MKGTYFRRGTYLRGFTVNPGFDFSKFFFIEKITFRHKASSDLTYGVLRWYWMGVTSPVCPLEAPNAYNIRSWHLFRGGFGRWAVDVNYFLCISWMQTAEGESVVDLNDEEEVDLSKKDLQLTFFLPHCFRLEVRWKEHPASRRVPLRQHCAVWKW